MKKSIGILVAAGAAMLCGCGDDDFESAVADIEIVSTSIEDNVLVLPIAQEEMIDVNLLGRNGQVLGGGYDGTRQSAIRVSDDLLLSVARPDGFIYVKGQHDCFHQFQVGMCEEPSATLTAKYDDWGVMRSTSVPVRLVINASGRWIFHGSDGDRQLAITQKGRQLFALGGETPIGGVYRDLVQLEVDGQYVGSMQPDRQRIVGLDFTADRVQ